MALEVPLTEFVKIPAAVLTLPGDRIRGNSTHESPFPKRLLNTQRRYKGAHASSACNCHTTLTEGIKQGCGATLQTGAGV